LTQMGVEGKKAHTTMAVTPIANEVAKSLGMGFREVRGCVTRSMPPYRGMIFDPPRVSHTFGVGF